MLILISPAKTLDYKTPVSHSLRSQPDFVSDSSELIEVLREQTPEQVASLMSISDKLAALNVARYLSWEPAFGENNSKPALFAFKGDVYTGINADTLTEEDIVFAQSHLRILSGLYGLLKPMDWMQPYRLEMGTKLANTRGKNLYEFWGERITDAVNHQLAQLHSNSVINLASNEYFKSVKPKQLNANVITPVFKDYKNGQYKIISFYAKKARGLMSAWAIKNRVTEVEQLKQFDEAGYYFKPDVSGEHEWVFYRDHQE